MFDNIEVFKMRKKKKNIEPRVCEGIKISNNIYKVEENRLKFLVFRGVMTYLFCASGICGFLSCSGTKHTAWLINLVLLVTALFISCIHIEKKIEKRGSIIFLILIIIFGFGLSLYINSGFYAVLNDINEMAKEYFDYTGIRTYAEPINNRLLAVNIAAVAIGVLCNFLFNMWLRRMMYLDAFLLVLLMIIYPAYIECEPDLIYVIMLMVATTMSYVVKKSDHFDRRNLEDDISKLYVAPVKKMRKFKGNKTDIKVSFRYNLKSYMQVGGHILICIVGIVLFMQVCIPKSSYYENNYETSYKENSKERVGLFVRQGLAGFFNYYENVAGMSDGRVGGVGIVNLDYNTDFYLRFTPYSEETIYLKEKSYVEYMPYYCRWLDLYDSSDITTREDKIKLDKADENEALTLKKAYEDEVKKVENKSGVAQSKKTLQRKTTKTQMELENVGLLDIYFRPYYTTNDDMYNGSLDDESNYNKRKIAVYPRLDKNDTKVKKTVNLTPYLRYSEKNEEAIIEIVKKASLSEDMEPMKIVSKLAAYFQKEYTYTLNPGTTPYKNDFVNHFVQEHKKGYCVHFATTATLVFRYLGIPARYTEGYAVHFEDVLNGTALTEEISEDEIDGYTELDETGYIEIEVKDSQAHAWVEIYHSDYGWMPVEVTPASEEEEVSSAGGFWNRFMGIFSNGATMDNQNNVARNAETKNNDKNKDFLASKWVKKIVIVIIIGFLISAFVGLVKLVRRYIFYKKANINDKLIMDYSRLIRRKQRRYRLLKEQKNYNSQLMFLYNKHEFRVSVEENVVYELIYILDRAGFSNELIKEDEDTWIRDILGIARFNIKNL